jgi:hypothetical protein
MNLIILILICSLLSGINYTVKADEEVVDDDVEEYIPGIDSFDFIEHRFTETLARQYVDAVVNGMSIETKENGEMCLHSVYQVIDSFHFVALNYSEST